jgi:hypothetical protein
LGLVRSSAFDLARDLAVQPQDTLPFNSRAFDARALDALPRLHDEAGRDLRLAQFLARAPQACIVLLIAGALVALSSANGLAAEFTWAVMLLAGIVVIVSNHMRNFAALQPRQSLQAAVSHLRGLFLYAGLAWGSGAFLVLPGEPVPVLTFVFAVVPAAVLALIVKDRQAIAAFAAPASVATVIAALLAGWPQAAWVSAAILAALPGIIALPALQKNPLRLSGP